MTDPTTTLVHLPPTELTIDANVRSEAALTAEFVQSVAEHGVLVPIVAQRTNTGELHVLYGQRRTLAAVEAARPTVPVHVVDSTQEAERIARQVVENDQRTGLSEADRAQAFHQLSLLGMKPSAIAKTTGTKRATVQTALAVMTNDTAHQALIQGMTLDQAAVLEEVSDNPADVAALQEIVERRPDLFEHHAQRIRDRRAGQAQAVQLRTEAQEAGRTVLQEHELASAPWEYRGPDALVHELRHPDGTALGEEEATAVVIAVDEWGRVRTAHIVQDWRGAGLTKAGGTSGGGGPMSEEDKAERRAVIANNKAWDSATTVRRTWLVSLLGRKALPKDATSRTAVLMVHCEPDLTRAGELACTLLGLTVPEGYDGARTALRQAAQVANARSGHISLAVLLGTYEERTGRHTWRHPGPLDRLYFEVLQSWGYSLAEVEQLVPTDTATP